MLGPSPVIDGEDARLYDRLVEAVVSVLKPQDVLEWIWVRDIVDNQWELQRYRLVQTHWMDEEAKRERINPFTGRKNGPGVALSLAVSRVLNSSRNKPLDAIVMGKELRRNNAHRELERR